MSNVVGFPPKKEDEEKLVWCCGHCRSSSFSLYNDGTVECCGCNTVSEGQEWIRHLPSPDPEAEITKDDLGIVNVIRWGDPQVARKRVVNFIKDNEDEIVILYAALESGKMSAWEDIITEDHKIWALEKIDAFREGVARWKPSDEVVDT